MIGIDRRSGSVGLGARMASGDACDRQITHRAQSCAGWPGFCCAGCVPSSAWQIGTSPAGPAPMSSGASEIVARRRIWHQTASSDAANPTVGFSLRRETAFRFSTRRTDVHSICQIGTTSLAPRRRQATAPSWRVPVFAALRRGPGSMRKRTEPVSPRLSPPITGDDPSRVNRPAGGRISGGCRRPCC